MMYGSCSVVRTASLTPSQPEQQEQRTERYEQPCGHPIPLVPEERHEVHASFTPNRRIKRHAEQRDDRGGHEDHVEGDSGRLEGTDARHRAGRSDRPAAGRPDQRRPTVPSVDRRVHGAVDRRPDITTAERRPGRSEPRCRRWRSRVRGSR